MNRGDKVFGPLINCRCRRNQADKAGIRNQQSPVCNNLHKHHLKVVAQSKLIMFS